MLESFIVRIYRHEKKKPRSLVGVVESAGVEEKKAFTNLDELWSILTAIKDTQKKSKKSELPAKSYVSERRTETRTQKAIPFVFIFQGKKVNARTMDYSPCGFGMKVNDRVPMHVGDVMNLKSGASDTKAYIKWVRTTYKPSITKAGFKVDKKFNLKNIKTGKHLLMRGGNGA